MRDFSIQPEQVQGAGPAFSTASADVQGAVGQLQSALAGLGNFWGDDEQGAQFAAGYQPQAEKVQLAAGNIATGLSSVAEGLDAHGANHSAADSASSARFAK